MQGNLNEIDIRSILQLIELGQRTGLLFVETYNPNGKNIGVSNSLTQHGYSDGKQFWFVFFVNGQIIYASIGNTYLSRLSDYLRHYRINVPLEEIQLSTLRLLNVPEYECIWALLKQNLINPTQARNIIQNMIHETLFDLLGLRQGSFIFELSPALTPQLTTWKIAPLVTKMIMQLQEWKQLYPFIKSPEQFPMLTDIAQLQSSLPQATLHKLKIWADDKTSLRQLARYLNRDILTVAKAMYPYVKQGWVKFVYSINTNTQDFGKELEVSYKARIVCIDDTAAICETVLSILERYKYKVTTLTDPLEALSSIFQFKPDLILCDIAMPGLDGYEICKMLRYSTAFRLVPIIMLVEALDYTSHIKAKMLGATDCLTKPFGNTELLKLVERYVNYTVVWAGDRDTTLVDPSQHEVKNKITESESLNLTN